MRGKLLNKLADLMEAKAEEFAALESLDVGESLLSYITVSVARTDSL
jgi:acyl-CoA reductase-like NAD-dependent aldehyde dehydrogenase